MRITILKDTKISETEVLELQRQFEDIFFGFEIQWFVHDRDYVFYPTYVDNQGHIMPSQSFRIDETDFVFNKYGKWGTDHVVTLIHKDNWKSDPPGPNNGIWGLNVSNVFHGYQWHYCRFDPEYLDTHSIGTFYHEIMHNVDALVKVETGVDVASLLSISDWDNEVVHGNNPNYVYINRKDHNVQVLDYVTPYLLQSYANRKERFNQEYQGLQKTILQLLKTVLVLLRQKLNHKTSIKP